MDATKVMDATKPQTDREWLIQIDGKVDSILERLEKSDNCMKDHEDRLSKLEKFQSTLIGIAAAISITISTGGYWILNRLLHGGS